MKTILPSWLAQDFSAAFDIVNTELLCKRLDIIGIPADVVSLIRIWLTKRFPYVSVNGDNLHLIAKSTGTIQGSILGPILYVILVSPIFELEKLSNYANVNYIVRWKSSIKVFVSDMKTIPRSNHKMAKRLRSQS